MIVATTLVPKSMTNNEVAKWKDKGVLEIGVYIEKDSFDTQAYEHLFPLKLVFVVSICHCRFQSSKFFAFL